MDALGISAHILFGTLAFGVVISLDFILAAVARTRRMDALRAVYETTAKAGRFIGLLFLAAILLGGYIAHERHEPMHATWLLASYGLLLLGIVFNVAVVQRRTKTLLRALDASDGTLTSELDRTIRAVRPAGAWVSLAIMAAIIALMVFKPA